MRILTGAVALLATTWNPVRGFGTGASNWVTAPAGIACERPQTCTALTPWQTGFDALGLTLSLSQRRCFASDGSNDPSCCAGALCAAWAGASVETTETFSEGILEVIATLSDPQGVAFVDSVYPMGVGTHRYSVIRSDGWLAVTMDGTLVSNASGVAASPLRIRLLTGVGSAPVLTFEQPPPGAPNGKPAAFSVGAGAVQRSGEIVFVNTAGRATVTIPPVASGTCAPCPFAASVVSEVFSGNVSGSIAYASDAKLLVSSVRRIALSADAVNAALTPTAADLAAIARANAAAASAAAAKQAAERDAVLSREAAIRAGQVASTSAAVVLAQQLVPDPMPPPMPPPGIPAMPPAPPSLPGAPGVPGVPSVPSQPATAETAATAFDVQLPGNGSSLVYVGTFAIGANTPYVSDADMSAAMSAASHLAISASMTFGTVITILQSVGISEKYAAAMAKTFGLSHVSFHIETDVKAVFVVPIQVTPADVTVALGGVRDVYTTAAKCISVYASGAVPTDMASIINAMHAEPLAVSTDDVSVVVKEHPGASDKEYAIMYALGAGAAVLVAATLAMGIAERAMRPAALPNRGMTTKGGQPLVFRKPLGL